MSPGGTAAISTPSDPNFMWTGLVTVAPFFGSTKNTRAFFAAAFAAGGARLGGRGATDAPGAPPHPPHPPPPSQNHQGTGPRDHHTQNLLSTAFILLEPATPPFRQPAARGLERQHA